MENIAEDIRDSFLELERHSKTVNEKLRIYLAGLSKKNMKDKIIQMNLSDKSLNFLCEGIALEHQDYEICAVVEEIKRDRSSKRVGDGQAP